MTEKELQNLKQHHQKCQEESLSEGDVDSYVGAPCSKKKNSSYKPLPDCLEIGQSDIDGVGVFAKEYIYAGQFCNFLGETHAFHDGIFYMVNFGGFINHSKNPNCKLAAVVDKDDYKSFQIYPIRDIKEGEEITLDYRVEACGLSGYEDEEWMK